MLNESGGIVVAVALAAGTEKLQRVIQKMRVELRHQLRHFMIPLLEFKLVRLLHRSLQPFRHFVDR